MVNVHHVMQGIINQVQVVYSVHLINIAPEVRQAQVHVLVNGLIVHHVLQLHVQAVTADMYYQGKIVYYLLRLFQQADTHGVRITQGIQTDLESLQLLKYVPQVLHVLTEELPQPAGRVILQCHLVLMRALAQQGIQDAIEPYATGTQLI